MSTVRTARTVRTVSTVNLGASIRNQLVKRRYRTNWGTERIIEENPISDDIDYMDDVLVAFCDELKDLDEKRILVYISEHLKNYFIRKRDILYFNLFLDILASLVDMHKKIPVEESIVMEYDLLSLFYNLRREKYQSNINVYEKLSEIYRSIKRN